MKSGVTDRSNHLDSRNLCTCILIILPLQILHVVFCLYTSFTLASYILNLDTCVHDGGAWQSIDDALKFGAADTFGLDAMNTAIKEVSTAVFCTVVSRQTCVD